MNDGYTRLAAALADRYRLERELGQGGMATVYLAQDLRHDRRVAVKVLRPELAAVIGAERFLAEIKTTAALQHPHILPLFDSGHLRAAGDGSGAAEFLFYVMPYVEGESLRDRLNREKQLPIPDAVRVATEVASALDYAHRHGVIHRDIKPENILLHDGQALVADFGIALAVSAAGGNRMTETGMSLGTPHYMSPEQAMGERVLDARTDIYALGCVTYEMLVGEPPFTGPTAQAIVAKVMTTEPAGITAQRNTVPPPIEAAVLTALAKLPADRYATAAEFAGALAGTGPTRTIPRVTPEAVSPAGPWRTVAIATAAVALVGIAFALWGWRRSPLRPVIRVSMSFPAGERIQAAPSLRFAISPDGSRIAYIGPDTSGGQLWIREMNSLHARPLPGTPRAQAPFFSPDGRSIAYFTGNPGDLRTVPVDGGPVQIVVHDSARPWGGDWATDGKLYFEGNGSNIARVAAGGGLVEQVSVRDSARGVREHDWPQVLPNGKGALVQVWYSSAADAEIGVLDFATHRVRPILKGLYARYLPTGQLVYATSVGTLLAVRFDLARMEPSGAPTSVIEDVQIEPNSGTGQFAISRTGTLLYLPGGTGIEQVLWFGRDGKSTPVDSAWRGTFTDLALSPDASRLAVTLVTAEGQQVWVKQLDAGPLTRLTFAGGLNYRATWVPDGRRLAFISNRSGLNQAWIQRADGSAEAESLAASPRQVDEIVWAPNGQTYAFRVGSGGINSRDIYTRASGPDSVARVLVASPFDEFGADISPDGRWFAYVSNESGREEVYVRRFTDPGAGKWQVSVDGGNEPRWAHSGRELFFRTPRGEMMVAEVVPSATFASQPPQLLFRAPDTETSPNHRAYDVSRDDRRFLMIGRTHTYAAELVLVLNWSEELKTRMKQ